MQKKLTITVDEEVYKGLHNVVGRGNISQFIEALIRPHVVSKDLEAAYQQMAQDEAREAEALEWSEGPPGSRQSREPSLTVGLLNNRVGQISSPRVSKGSTSTQRLTRL